LIFGAAVKAGVDLGTVKSFSAIGSTVCDYLGVSADFYGESCVDKILAEQR
jgi:phosphopentomutase